MLNSIYIINVVLEFQNIPVIRLQKYISWKVPIPTPDIGYSRNMSYIVLLITRDVIPPGLFMVKPLLAGAETMGHTEYGLEPDK